MSEIQQLISDIKAFMAGANQSYHPRLKVMYERYREHCVELAGMLDRCRRMVDSGLGADARSFNLQNKPTLVQRFRFLNFPGRKEFVTLCEDYGLAPMPPWDSEIVDWLEAPINEVEVKVSSLMQQWRRIARKGSSSEKIRVLRQIVVAAGVSDGSWKKNLAEEEHRRYAEIEAALPRLAGAPDELERLREISLELYSPQLLTTPKEELLRALQERLQPLQAAEHARKLEDVLARMQESYARQDIDALRESCTDWEAGASNPMASPTPEQIQTVKDVREFLRQHDEREERERTRVRLIDELSRMLEKATPFEELERKYGELERLEMDFPDGLRVQMEARREEYELQERRRHVRRCVYGVALALLCLGLTGLGIFLLQYRNRLRTVCAEMTRLKDAGQFEEGLEVFEALKKDAPRVSRASEVEVLVAELRQGLEDREGQTVTAQAEFGKILQTVRGLLAKELLESKEIDELLRQADAKKELLTDAQKVDFVGLLGDVSKARDDMRKRRAAAFNAMCDQLQERLAGSLAKISEGRHEASVAEMTASLQALRNELEQRIAESKVDANVTNHRKNMLEKEFEVFEAAIAQEERYQRETEALADVADVEGYLELLASCNGWSLELQKNYADACARLPQWRADVEDAQLVQSFSVERDEVAERLTEHGARSLFLREYDGRFKNDALDALAKYCKDAEARYGRYEIRFRDEHGAVYCFYSEKEAEQEMDRRYAGRLNYLKVWLDADAGKPQTLAVFKYQPQQKAFDNRLAAEHPEWGMPASLLEDGWQMQKCPAAALLKSMATQADSRDGREAAAWEILAEAAAMDLNPYIKHDILVNVLAALVKLDDWYSQQLTPILDSLRNIAFKGAWNHPGACRMAKREAAQLDKVLNALDWQVLRSQRAFLWKFRKALYERRLMPVGVTVVRNDAFSLRLFVDRLPPELLVIEKQTLHKLFSEVPRGTGAATVAAQDVGFLFNGQIVWGYSDGLSFGDFLEKWRTLGEKEGCAPMLKTHLWPKEY